MIRKLFSIKQKLLELDLLQNKNLGIFMFHKIIEKSMGELNNMTISLQMFENFILRLQNEGTVFTTPDYFENLDYSKQYGVITFDDMYDCSFESAIPFLQSNSIPYVVFISPSLVDKPGYITKEHLQSLIIDPLCTVGAHGINHKIMRMLQDKEKKVEISRIKHEELLGCKMDYFAFPYGSVYACDKLSVQLATEQYKYCFSTISKKIDSRKISSYKVLPRINIDSENYQEIS